MIFDNISIVKNNECVGCCACVETCPIGIISVSYDSKGFVHPAVDEKKCINCGKCLSVCPSLAPVVNVSGNSKLFIGINSLNEDRLKSSSGGISTILAEIIINNKGSVYGACFDNKFRVCHLRIDRMEDIGKMRGSKYVQSDMNLVFKEIKTDLINGKNVLFTGLPCQCHALRRFVNSSCKGKKGDIFFCDLICHGVVSPLIWTEYVKWRSRRHNIKHINFRDKRYGSQYYALSIDYSNGKNVCSKDSIDPFIDIFKNDYAIRECCEKCNYRGLSRQGDITLGDYSGSADGLDDIFFDGKGKSLIILNNSKGEKLFNKVRQKIVCQEIESNNYSQPNYGDSSTKIKEETKFWTDYYKHGFIYVMYKYTEKNIIVRLSHRVKSVMRRIKLIYNKL